MGYKLPLDVNSITHQIYISGVELRSHRTDGFNQWHIKQELYKLKWLLDDILSNSPEFTGEQEFLEQHEREKIIEVLSK